MSVLFVIPAVFGIGDIVQRFKEYRKMRSEFRKGYIITLRHSACQRMAVIAAAPNPKEVRKHFKDMGYRWYHIVPDGTFTRKSPYLSMSFYLGLLGLGR